MEMVTAHASIDKTTLVVKLTYEAALGSAVISKSLFGKRFVEARGLR